MSFDRIDSDGCMSTNDAVIVMVSGSAQTAPDIDEFTTVLTDLCVDLAQQLIADAEGASKDIAITVREAASESDALEAARTIARSNLLKCAIHGEDPGGAGSYLLWEPPRSPSSPIMSMSRSTASRCAEVAESATRVREST